jgi:cytochrome c556
MFRKWTTLLAVMCAVAVTCAGISMADDEESPVHKLMEKVNATGNAIKKATRTAVAYKKSQAELPKLADEMIDLAKKAKAFKEPSEKQKKQYSEWEKLCDDWIKEAEKFKDVVAKPTTKQEAAKKAYNTVNTTCTDCHKVFRVEEDDK